MSYSDHFRAHLRLCMLRLLADAPASKANASILRSAASELGLESTRDQLNTEIRWLDEQGLVVTHEVGGLLVAELTERGADVAAGRARVDGVIKPTPAARG